MNIGDYEHFQDTLMGKYGLLNMHYYVLPKNLDLAKTHFEQVNPMMHFFEKKFGPFPFYKDGYKLVETPYLGMEHQTCIAYGNQYQKGYLGLYPKNIDFDFILYMRQLMNGGVIASVWSIGVICGFMNHLLLIQRHYMLSIFMVMMIC